MALFGLQEIAEAMDRGYRKTGYNGALGEFVKGAKRLYARDQFVPQWIARFYMRMGNQEQALKWLQKDYETRADRGLVDLNIDPVWDPLRSEPKFKDLVRLVAFPEINVAALNANHAEPPAEN